MSASTSSTSCVPHAPGEYPLRWWLWFVLEHEIHHKAQLAVYVRQMGYTPPFYALPMPLGARPDVAARRQLQGDGGGLCTAWRRVDDAPSRRGRRWRSQHGRRPA